MRAEVTKSVRVVQGACMDLDKNLRGMDANTQSALEEERARRQKVILLLYVNILSTCKLPRVTEYKCFKPLKRTSVPYGL